MTVQIDLTASGVSVARCANLLPASSQHAVTSASFVVSTLSAQSGSEHAFVVVVGSGGGGAPRPLQFPAQITTIPALCARSRAHCSVVELIKVVVAVPLIAGGRRQIGTEPQFPLPQVVEIFTLFSRDYQLSRLPPITNLQVVLQPLFTSPLLRFIIDVVVLIRLLRCVRFVCLGGLAVRVVHRGGSARGVVRGGARRKVGVVIIVVGEPARPVLAWACPYTLVLVLGLRPRRWRLALGPID
mmetsp:Transcript_21641/g.49708  ORF Transcript_21641/g.49708 Transcript_21641/m.49708 type:complete len:242 (-) Transcript_21641:579-1304(-)